jgi:hypothetical protein
MCADQQLAEWLGRAPGELAGKPLSAFAADALAVDA